MSCSSRSLLGHRVPPVRPPRLTRAATARRLLHLPGGDELKLGLEMARAEQTQAREQAELAELRLEESRRATSERAAAKAKVELDDVREHRAAALADLRAARTEAESLEKASALRGRGGRGGGAGAGVAGEGADRCQSAVG